MTKKLKSKLLIFLILLLAISYMLFANAAQAQILKGIVPCGKTSDIGTPNQTCTVCHLFVLIKNLIDFMLYVAAPLVTLAAIFIGFQFLFSGGSPAKISDAKGKLRLLVIGIFWVFGSWLVISSILNFFADQKVFPWPWNKISCEVSQPTSQPPGVSGGGWGPLTPAVTSRLDNNPLLPATDYGGIIGGVWEDAVQTDTAGYQALDTEHVGLEQVDPAASYTATDPVSPTVDQKVDQEVQKIQPEVPPPVQPVGINGVDPNLVKSIIQAESSGNTNAIHVDKDGKASYGLMQVRPDTARRYGPELKGLSDAQVGERLKDPSYNMKIGTAYLQDLGAKYNGDLNKVIAAYNGGPGANKPSVDCPGSSRWQCQWDNKAHTVPNTGYAVTRKYVNNVNNYYSQLSK